MKKKVLLLTVFVIIVSGGFGLEAFNIAAPGRKINFEVTASSHIFVNAEFKIEQKELYLCVNTASKDNILTGLGIEKLFGSTSKLYRDIYDIYMGDFEDLPKNKAIDQIEKDCKNGTKKYYLQVGNQTFLMDPYDIYVFGKNNSPLKKITDGVIGQDFLTKFDNVVIDFVSYTMSFNQNPLKEFSVKMEYNSQPDYHAYYIPFYVNRLKYNGQINTGSPAIILSEQLVDKQIEIYKQNGQTFATVNDFRIGDKTIEKMGVMYKPNMKKISGDDKSLNLIGAYNILGYTAFKDSIIQLDFKNMVFRMM